MQVNWTALAVVAAGAAVSAAIAMPQWEKDRELQELQANCGNAMVQIQARHLAISTMKERFKTLVKREGWSDAEVEKKTNIDLKDFYLVKVDPASLHTTCGATVDFSLKKDSGGRLRSTANILEFEVHGKVPTSWTVTMASGTALQAAIESLKPEQGSE